MNEKNLHSKIKQSIIQSQSIYDKKEILNMGYSVKPMHDHSENSGEDRDWRSGSKDEPTQADKDADVKITEIKSNLEKDLEERQEEKGK